MSPTLQEVLMFLLKSLLKFAATATPTMLLASLGEIYFHQRWEPDRLIHTYLSTTGWNMFFSNVQTLPADFVAFGGKDTT